MKRNIILTSVAGLAVAAAAPAFAAPGGNGGGMAGGLGGGIGRVNAGGGLDRANAGAGGGIDTGTSTRGIGRTDTLGSLNTSTRSSGRIDTDNMVTGSRIPLHSRNSEQATTSTRTTSTRLSTSQLTGVTSGMTVVDSSGSTIGTVSGVTTLGNGSTRTVQVTLTNGQIITLAPNSLSLNGSVVTTNSLTSNVRSQGVAHANINGLIHASPRSALASAGVTTLTGLATGLTVNNSGGTAIGTVNQVFTNSSGAVVGIQVDLTAGGSVLIPATTLSMNGTTVVTNSTQF